MNGWNHFDESVHEALQGCQQFRAKDFLLYMQQIMY